MNTDTHPAPAQPHTPVASPVAGGPAPESTRHLAMDAARGLALLGIFLVNIQFFASSLLDFFAAKPPPGSSTGDAAVFYFTVIFCQSRSYPLFSLLFGMGLALQMGRADASGRRFFPLYLRRLAALALFGIIHIIVLWYGDILLFYAIAGFVLLLLSRLSAKWLLGIGVGIIGFGLVAGTAVGALFALAGHAGDEPRPPLDPAITSRTPIERLVAPGIMERVFSSPGGPSGEAAQSLDNQASQIWRGAETEAFRDGPFRQALYVRLLFYVMMLGFSLTSFLWHVLAMFCIGAALVKFQFFSPEHGDWPRRLTLCCLVPGVVLSVFFAVAPQVLDMRVVALFGATEVFIVPTLFALGYFGAMAWLCNSGCLAPITAVLAATGRMALTNYLLQSTIAALVMYHWGLAKFGTFDRVERAAFVGGVYACQLIFSVLWLRFFRFGPMEWLWRSMTYLKLQPIRRATPTDAPAA